MNRKFSMTIGPRVHHGRVTDIRMDSDVEIKRGLLWPDVKETTGDVTLFGEIFTDDGQIENFSLCVDLHSSDYGEYSLIVEGTE